MWTDKRLGVIGGGNMAEALVRGVIRAGLLTPDRIAVFDISPDRLAVFAGLGCAASDSAAGVLGADVVLLATKPQQLRSALSGVPVGAGQLLVSILAGVPTTAIEAMLPPGSRVVRTMPNTPLLVGQGMTALAGGSHATPDDVKTALALFAASGDAVEVAETDLDAVTALSGSGPAYLFYFYEALLRGAEVIGLEPALARRLAFGTLKGALAMLEDGGDEVELRRRVTSPGGTTAAAIAALDNGRFAGVVADALEAACRRSVELGRGNG
ncbi:MAG: pyrroline-5-carboxylate reductase [Planctomycetaceae bacterium]|nr:pyrroline-5-carboxylate reductase [Planctomycetaceae bacterium]